MKYANQIKQFCNYFSEQINVVAALNNRLAKKLLYVAIIDTLGRARYPNGSNRKRIISFIDNYSGWIDKNRCSLVQLSLHLKHILNNDEKNSNNLYIFVNKSLSLWKIGAIYRSDVDPSIEDVLKIAITDEERNAIKFARYTELFYIYRNKMVHEFREPGYSIEMSDDDSTPYYHSYDNKPWQLVFPLACFKVLCESCLNGLKEYLLKENINPYKQYEFGDMWNESSVLKNK